MNLILLGSQFKVSMETGQKIDYKNALFCKLELAGDMLHLLGFYEVLKTLYPAINLKELIDKLSDEQCEIILSKIERYEQTTRL